MSAKKAKMPAPEDSLPGRLEEMPVAETHAVLGTPMKEPFDGVEFMMVGLGCFWGAERIFWQVEGVHSTAVGYAAGFTPNPTYEEVCTGQTGHNEVVRIVFDPSKTSFEKLLQVFWESHNPTQGMRQGNDIGSQYRSGIYLYSHEQREQAQNSKSLFQSRLREGGFGEITTEIIKVPKFYFAEDYHQQYLHKNPQGYCGLGGTGISCPIGTKVE